MKKIKPAENPNILIGVTHSRSLGFHTDLARELNGLGYQVHLVSSPGPDLAQISKSITVHPLRMAREPNVMQDIRSFFQWLILLYKVRPTIVFIGTPKASLLGIIAARLLRVPVRIYFVHGLRFESARGRMRVVLISLEKLAMRFATNVIAVSPSVRSKILELNLTKSQEVVVIGSGSASGLDLDKFQSIESGQRKKGHKTDLGLDSSLLTIGFVGRLTAEKGIVELQEALLDLNSEGYNFQVLLVGKPEDSAGAQIGANLEAKGIKVLAPGHVNETMPYFRAMDIMCLPTYREGLGNVLLEAFASEVPVVATSVTGVVDLVKDGDTGLLIPPRDSHALAEAIKQLFEDGELRRYLQRNAQQFVTQNFDREKVINQQVVYLLSKLPEIGE